MAARMGSWPLDRRRYTTDADVAYTKAKAIEVYQTEHVPAYPNEEREAGRPLKTSSLDEAQGQGRASRRAWGGASDDFDPDDGIEEHTLSFRREPSWRDAVAAEVRVVRVHVGVSHPPGFTKFEVSVLGC